MKTWDEHALKDHPDPENYNYSRPFQTAQKWESRRELVKILPLMWLDFSDFLNPYALGISEELRAHYKAYFYYTLKGEHPKDFCTMKKEFPFYIADNPEALGRATKQGISAEEWRFARNLLKVNPHSSFRHF